MRRSALSISITCTMLTLSFIIIVMSTGASTHKVNTKAKAKEKIRVANIPPQLPDPPGTIDGAKHPELIPDRTAYMLVFHTIATPNNSEFEINRSRAWAAHAGLTIPDADKLIAVANEFCQQDSLIDAKAKEVRDLNLPNAELLQRGAALKSEQDAAVDQMVALLHIKLGGQLATKLHTYVTVHLKEKMKILPASNQNK